MRSARLASLAAAAAVLASGCDDARLIEQRSGLNACARCHGFPPSVVTRTGEPHPQSTSCQVCHGTTVGEDGQLLPNGTHLNGRIDVQAHPLPYLAQHRVEVYGGLEGCTPCHGTDFDGGIARSCTDCHQSIGFADWQTNCTFCHGTRTAGWTPAQIALAAPPLAGNPENDEVPDYRGIGAHRAHVQADTFANPLACTECHAQPSTLTHIDGAAPVIGGPLATHFGTAPATFDDADLTCANYCHGETLPFAASRPEPVWAPPSTVACGACHEADPTTGRHPALGTGHATFECFVCHGGTHTETAPDRARHVNGTIETTEIAGFDPLTRNCTAVCHVGSRNWGAAVP